MYPRRIEAEILAASADTPVIYIAGARQVGKSTLVQKISENHFARKVLSLDDSVLRHQAKRDPASFIRNLKLPVAIDEVQRVPELLYEIKAVVDNLRSTGKPTAGAFLLTGSSELQDHIDSLAGRIERLQLWPFSQGEIAGQSERFIDSLFQNQPPNDIHAADNPEAIAQRIVCGGYPEAYQRSPQRRTRWFEEYLNSIVERDVRQLSLVRSPELMTRLFSLAAARAGNLLNIDSLISDLGGLKRPTGHRYFELLKRVYLIYTLPAWSRNRSTQVVKSPKIYMNDSGLLCSTLGYDKNRILTADGTFPSPGNIFENFVVGEIVKQASWHPDRPKLFHFRNRNNLEVDVIIERANGDIAGIECKYKRQVEPRDWSGLAYLRRQLGEQFRCGAVIYTGEHTIELEDHIWAVPVESLWSNNK